MALDSVYRVRTLGRLRSQRVEFGVHAQQVLASGGPDDLLASWAATIMPLVVAATSAEVNWESLIASDTSETGDESVDLELTQPMPGALGSDCLPGQNAVCVQLRTGTKGRRRRGRFFLPGVTETGHQNGRLTGAQLTAVQGLAQGIVNAYGPAGTETSYRLVVFSPEVLTFPPPKPKKPRPGTIISRIVGTNIDEIVRTQRRRSIGTGI
jgi:hypothetical protein